MIYKSADLLSTGQRFQFFQDGFDYTSTSGLRFSTVSGSLRLQFRLLTSGPRFEKNSALRAACTVHYRTLLCYSVVQTVQCTILQYNSSILKIGKFETFSLVYRLPDQWTTNFGNLRIRSSPTPHPTHTLVVQWSSGLLFSLLSGLLLISRLDIFDSQSMQIIDIGRL